MASGRPHRPNDPSVMASVEFALSSVARPGLVARLWHWRYETGLLFGLAAVALASGYALGAVWLIAIIATGLGLLAASLSWAPTRQRLIARAWCVITPHRVRVGCVNAWVQTRGGRLPIILATAPTDYGEQVRLWLRAGLTTADLYAAREVLAAACWAMEVRVVPSARHAHLATLEVVRARHAERRRPTPEAWPNPRRVADETLGGADERDTRHWPDGVVPPPRLSPEEDWPGLDRRSPVRVPDDEF